jgi:uncharacterized membrane protein (DUF485 family)
LLHEPAPQHDEDLSADYKSRLGIRLFVVYALFYGGFVAINLASPLAMESIVFLGWNLATVYGFGLIIGAMALAVIYDRMCKKHEDAMAEDKEKGS